MTPCIYIYIYIYYSYHLKFHPMSRISRLSQDLLHSHESTNRHSLTWAASSYADFKNWKGIEKIKCLKRPGLLLTGMRAQWDEGGGRIVLASCRVNYIILNFFVIKPTRCTNFKNIFVMKLYMFRTVRLSITRSWFTVHSAMVYVIQQLSKNLYNMYHCRVYCE